ncbi:MAG: hypothetical protein HYX72_14465 [Acidobacteria bacterium]|nr:hypothetical protein [Acidobacteriota bacterium]
MAVVSLRAYARHRGVSLKAVQKAIESGRITKTPDGKIDPERADAEWERNTSPKPRRITVPVRKAPIPKPASPEAPTRTDVSGMGALDYAKARAVREQYLARLAKIEFEERSGKLISRDEVTVAAFNKFRTFRDGILNIPDRVAALLAAESDPHKVHEILTTEIRKALLEFADASNG